MPKESINVYLTAVDGVSPVFASIADKTKALDKESQQLKQTYEALQKANAQLIQQKTALQKELQGVNEEVKTARKSFQELGDAASSDAYEKAQQRQQELRNKIAGTTKALQENQKMYKENIEVIRKEALEGQGQDSGFAKALKGVLSGPTGQNLASAFGGMFQAKLDSALGDGMAGLVSESISGAISGGMAGIPFGLPGIALGAAVGGASGLISSGTKIFEAKDDAFKDYYGGLYDGVKGRSGEMATAGSALASGREKDLISFKTMFGSEDTARQYLSELVEMSNRTPFLYDDLTAMSKTLATYGYNGKVGEAEDENSIIPLLRTIGDAGAALGMSTSDMNAVAQALGRMKSSNKATLEYLNILNDRGIGVFDMLAKDKGKDLGGIYDDISKGEITGGEAVTIITEALAKEPGDGGYLGAMEEQSATFEGISSTLEGMEQELENSGGEAYNKQRLVGLEAQKTAYEGELGNALKEINAVLGENQAQKENMQDQYMRDVLSMVLTGKHGDTWHSLDAEQQNELTKLSRQYQAAKERYGDGKDVQAGAELEAIYETAQALGEAYFDNSEFMRTLNRTELDEIEAIRNATVALNEATQASYTLSQELSKGRGAALFGADVPAWSYSAWENASENALKQAGLTEEGLRNMRAEAELRAYANSHAFGLDRVPWDGYPALLHEGERVLTASQARAQDAGQAAAPISITITGNSFTGAPEELADQLAQLLASRLEQAAAAAAPR